MILRMPLRARRQLVWKLRFRPSSTLVGLRILRSSYRSMADGYSGRRSLSQYRVDDFRLPAAARIAQGYVKEADLSDRVRAVTADVNISIAGIAGYIIFLEAAKEFADRPVIPTIYYT